MLEVTKSQIQKPQIGKKKQDLIITRYEKKIEYKGEIKTETRIPKKINVTKLVNETKKLIKKEKASDKIDELIKVFSEVNKK